MMANNMSSRQACHAARYVVARVLRGLFWCLKYTVILPLATMALMALFVLWKDNTTPGQLLVQEIDFVRQTAPAGQFPVRECLPSLHDLPGAEEKICRYRAADAADYVRETDRSLMQLVIRDNEGRVFARQGEVMNPLQYVPFNQTLYFINGDDPAQVAWMKRQTPPTLESKIILVQGSIPEMQKALDSRIYFDQNGVLCQRLGIDQVPARVSAVPGDRFLKVEFIPAEEGRK